MSGYWIESGGLYAYRTHTGNCHDACDGRTDPIDPPQPCYCSCHYPRGADR